MGIEVGVKLIDEPGDKDKEGGRAKKKTMLPL